MPNIRPPYHRGLAELHHRLAADQGAEKLRRIAHVHAASLPRPVLLPGQAAVDKQETPSPARDEASTNRNSSWESPGGRYTECA